MEKRDPNCTQFLLDIWRHCILPENYFYRQIELGSYLDVLGSLYDPPSEISSLCGCKLKFLDFEKYAYIFSR